MSRLLSLTLLLAALVSSGCGKPPQPTLSLYRAVHLGDLEQLGRHIYWRTDLNQPEPGGDMPLHAAVRAGRVGIARELIRHGADPGAANASGQTPLDLALALGKTQVARTLVESGARLDPQSALVALAVAGVSDRDSFDFLMRRGADPNRADPQGRTPLHLAVSGARLETLKRLLDKGADLNRPDGRGATPLALAEALDPKTPDRAAILKALRQYGARLETGPAPQP